MQSGSERLAIACRPLRKRIVVSPGFSEDAAVSRRQPEDHSRIAEFFDDQEQFWHEEQMWARRPWSRAFARAWTRWASFGAADYRRRIREQGGQPPARPRDSVALVALSTEAPTSALLHVLRDGERGSRIMALKAMGRSDDPGFEPALLETLADPDHIIASWAADGLGKRRSRAAVAPLIEALSAPDFGHRATAARALSRIGDRRAQQPLAALVRRERLDRKPRLAAYLARLYLRS